MTAALPAQTRRLISQLGAKLGGKTRGPDSGAGRRVPRRNSYEENDARAQPWRKVGDGSVAQGIAHREAKIEAADELRRQLWVEFPISEVRRRRHDLAAASAELAHLQTLSPAEVPVGRPATLRIEIAKLEGWLEQADNRLRRIDIDVLRALLTFWDFATGKLIPRHDTIAARAGVHENSVIDALKRLRAHGLVDWIRRTTRTGNAGEFGPQLEQTSNAYFFDHRRKMASRTWQAYWKRLCAKLRRFGTPRPSTAPGAAKLALVTAAAPLTPMQAALASYGASIDNATT
ncbi:hypothetical protein [uncultured Sphingomonas sp.]|uniref:hypothetical protein n=1 Tax=uncultured Sphingomonas sp. TaxID=158754 RepID=UPI00258783A8|nr:hypothetical protein [uncultured Sphingomonas sp.]